MSSSEILDQLLLRPGQILNEGRYKVHRKLGSGVFSTTWLVSDTKAEFAASGHANKYRAAKVLTIEGTDVHKQGLSRELGFLKQIAEWEECHGLPKLYDHFDENGPGGTHLCLIVDLLSTDVTSFRRTSPQRALPVHTVKNIVAAAVHSLAQLHELGIIHTDFKLDNMLFNSIPSDKYVEEQLEAEKITVEDEIEVDGVTYQRFRSQPIQHQFKWDMSPEESKLVKYVVSDLGQAQRANEQPTTNVFSAYSLRAPELLIFSDFSPKIDIWALGCLTFELLVGRWLFDPEEGKTWTVEDDHLSKMMELTGEKFSSAHIARAHRRKYFFNKKGKLLRIKVVPSQSIESAIRVYNVVPEDEIAGAAAFIRTCLRLDSYKRPSALELGTHPWLTT